ncbi:ArsR family transcriptional regulator [Flammeovirga sp. EKP202]|uniref:ArsR family transcriptional regulator n=1 Tax=Flammeovirga sp. EKP202 TaxID=2770592 RepID=UPI00165EEB65|nr:ArsR family transcriptional regulator [Flammeovirga sp. EKP202]MBD0404476.1 ArsR family transcriptional regulator [Flammeovirga sp. EKP202]
MLEALITSKTRLKLLLKFFLNPNNSAYLRGLAIELSESTNSIRVELNRLEKANMLASNFKGNKKFFRVNTSHPLFNDLQAIVHKYVGLDIIIDKVLNELGNLEEVHLVGNLAEGKNSKSIDLVVKGNINEEYLKKAIQKVEGTLERKINYTISPEYSSSISKPSLIIYSQKIK